MIGTHYITILIGGIVGVAVVSLIVGEIQWGLLIGLTLGITIAEGRTRKREKTGEVETDERVETNARKFMIQTMGTSLFILLLYLLVSDIVLNQEFVEVRYLTYYVLATFIVTLFIGPAIIKNK